MNVWLINKRMEKTGLFSQFHFSNELAKFSPPYNGGMGILRINDEKLAGTDRDIG